MSKTIDHVAGKCRHFNGVHNKQCQAGVIYANVRLMMQPGKGLRLPCFLKDECSDRCTLVSFLSEQEAIEEAARLDAAAESFIREMMEGKTCPHCHKPITKLYQVGRCVYNRGCGCRQYQGVVPKNKRTKADQEQIDDASMWGPLEPEEA